MTDDLTFLARGLYLDDADALVVADVHLGKDDASNVELPLGEREDVTDRLRRLLDRCSPADVVLAGDFLHTFSSVSYSVSEAVADLRSVVADAGASLVVTPGNHDAHLQAVYDGPTAAAYELADGTVVCHGHEAPDVDAHRYVVGHDHPAIVVEGVRRPCFLYGPGVYRDADVVALPAFTRLARGVVVNGATRGDLDSPLLEDVGDFHPVIYDPDADEALRFPPLKRLRRLL